MRKNRWKIMLIAGLLALGTLVACGDKGAGTNVDVGTGVDAGSEQKRSPEEILKAMEGANQAEALLGKHDQIAYRLTFGYGDGTESVECRYQNQEFFVSESEFMTIYDRGGEVFGEETGFGVYRALFIGDAHENFAKFFEAPVGYEYSRDEAVESFEETGGVLKIQTLLTDRNSVELMAESSLFDGDRMTKVRGVYLVEPDSYELISMEFAFVTEDGEELTFMKNERMDNAKMPELSAELEEAVFGGEQRTVTVIVDNGTEREKTYSSKVSKGCRCIPYLPDSYEQVGYIDPDYTEFYMDEDSTSDEDCVIYVRSGEID